MNVGQHIADRLVRAVQIDIDGARCGLRYPTEVNLTGDTTATLTALLPLLRPDGSAPDPAWRKQVDVDMRPSQSGHLTGLLLSMGGGMPYAIAAKRAHPDRPVVALIGDGAMQMNGVNDLIAIARYWKHWPDPRFIVLVLNNRELSFVSWETRALLGAKPDPANCLWISAAVWRTVLLTCCAWRMTVDTRGACAPARCARSRRPSPRSRWSSRLRPAASSRRGRVG